MTLAETAPAQVARLVGLLAWLSQRDSGAPVSYGAAARHLRVPERTVRDDLEALVGLTDQYKPWLSSLSVALLADGFVAESRGHFRRPFRLTADETIALLLGLAGVRGGRALAAKLGATFVRYAQFRSTTAHHHARYARTYARILYPSALSAAFRKGESIFRNRMSHCGGTKAPDPPSAQLGAPS